MKPFKLEGEELAEILHQGSPTGKLVIDIKFDSVTPAQARKLASWLIRAADHVVTYNRQLGRRKKEVE